MSTEKKNKHAKSEPKIEEPESPLSSETTIRFEDIPNASQIVDKYKSRTYRDSSNRYHEFLNEYENLLRTKIATAISKMFRDAKVVESIDVNFREKITINEKAFSINTLHYGFTVDNQWTKRTPIVMESEMPFRRLQTELLSKGYYLLDESDPAKSHATVINIYALKPYNYGQNRLWHGKNIIL